jgi:SAM-dependent methyltransferase
MTSNHDVSDLHRRQESHHKNILEDPQARLKSETWFEKDTVDYWRHKRIRDSIAPVISHFPRSTWLTVGDGRYGTDANYLLEHGLSAHASDIQDDLLTIGRERRFIGDYSKQNAESLSFADDQFDFVYCKESYHHFPRPAIALYEMLRVARKGVVLQEPKDARYFETPWQGLLHSLKECRNRLSGKERIVHSFEEAGNYVYSLSPRELQKHALGMNYGFIAYKVQQDCYIEGIEFEKANAASRLFRRVRRRIAYYEILYRMGFVTGGLMTGLILKEIPGHELITSLKSHSYKTEVLPRNPYKATNDRTLNT